MKYPSPNELGGAIKVLAWLLWYKIETDKFNHVDIDALVKAKLTAETEMVKLYTGEFNE